MNVFDDAVDRAVRAALGEAQEQGAEPSAADLRAVAERERESLLAQGTFAEDYRQAAARVPVSRADAPWVSALRIACLAGCPLSTLAACLLFGELTGQDIGGGGTAGGAAVALGVLVVAGAAILGAAWLLAPPDPAARRSPREAVAAVAGFVGVATVGALAFFTYAMPGWTTAGALTAGCAAWGAAFVRPVRTWWLALVSPRTAERDRRQLDTARARWRDALQEAILQHLRPEIQAAAERPLSTRLSVRGTLSLRRVRGEGHVHTPAEERLRVAADGMDDGSIALSGPRGVGKTELLRSFCADPARLSVVVVAPVLYDRRDFALHLFAEVCKRVEEDGPRPLRREAAQHLRQITYLQSHAAEAALNVPGGLLSLRHGGTRSRQPLTYPDIVHELKRFLTRVGPALDGGRRLVVGVDELDRIRPASAAQDFLNELKVIFDVPGCLFVLSVSDEALRAAELAPIGGRDVFDSAIDEVVRVEPLDRQDAARLLASRVIGLPVAFTGLFNALAGGIPRDLLRIARAAVLFTDDPVEEDLPDTARRLVARELTRITGSADNQISPEVLGLIEDEVTIAYGALRALGERVEAVSTTIANRLYFLDTVLGLFSAKLTPERVQRAAADGTFDALTRVGSRLGTADHQARAALVRLRRAAGLEPVPPLALGSRAAGGTVGSS